MGYFAILICGSMNHAARMMGADGMNGIDGIDRSVDGNVIGMLGDELDGSVDGNVIGMHGNGLDGSVHGIGIGLRGNGSDGSVMRGSPLALPIGTPSGTNFHNPTRPEASCSGGSRASAPAPWPATSCLSPAGHAAAPAGCTPPGG